MNLLAEGFYGVPAGRGLQTEIGGMNDYPRRFEGFTTWNRKKVREADFENFIMVSNDEILFELNYERSRYFGKLERHDLGWFAGTFYSLGYAGKGTGSARCSLKEEGGSLSLDGVWNEDGIEYDWHAELTET